jgi:hypothetical protein
METMNTMELKEIRWEQGGEGGRLEKRHRSGPTTRPMYLRWDDQRPDHDVVTKYGQDGFEIRLDH